MDIRRMARGLAVRAGVLLAVLAAIAVVSNLSWFDEPLHPEIARLAEPKVVSMAGNAYPLIYGLPAASDRDMRATGLAIVDTLRERHAARQPITLTADEMADMLGGTGLDAAWQSRIASGACNSRQSLDCADELLAEIARGVAVSPRLAMLLERYEQILAAPRFEESQEFDVTTPVPAYGLLMTVGRIRLALSYRNDPVEQFIARAEEDMAFWRGMLRDGQSLIAKMVALAGVRNNVELLSAAIRSDDLDDAGLAAAAPLLEPLSREERDIGDAFLSELRVALLSGKTVAIAPSEPAWPTRLLLQEQATLNEFYLTTVTPIRLRAALDAKSFYAQRGYEALTYNLRVFPPPLYNLGGKLMLKQQARSYNVQDYISRVHDVDGRIALVRLQAEIARSGDEQIESIVRGSAHRHPYTGESMDYDPERRVIGFGCLTDNVNDVCAVALGAAAR